MPRRPRIFAEGALYHVYNRAARGEPVFEDDAAAVAFLALMRRIFRRDGLTVYAWCIMPNHYHVVLRSGPVPISRTFGVLQGRFGQQRNWKLGSSGPLWQARYKAKLIEEEGYLYQVIAYVHLNPVAAGLADDPAEWRWSGHRELVRRRVDPLIEVDAVLSMYGATAAAAQREYVTSLKGTLRGEWVGEAPGHLPWWGREVDTFIETPVPAAWLDERSVSSGVERRPLKAEEYVAMACRLLDVAARDVASPRRGDALTRVRWLLASVGIERWRQSPRALGSLLGRHPDVLTRWARMGAVERVADPEFAAAADGLDEGLAGTKAR